MLLKQVLKIILKWILTIFFASETPAKQAESANGNGKASRAFTAQNGLGAADIFSEKTMSQVQNALDHLEERLDQKIEQTSIGTEHPVIHPEMAGDLNDLRAELAELRADIRSLKRSMNEHATEVHAESDPHD